MHPSSEKTMKSKSIKSYLIKGFSISSAVVFIILFVVIGFTAGGSIKTMKSNAIFNTLTAASDNITAQIDTMYATAYAIASDPDIYDQSISYENKKPKLEKYASELGINSIGYITGEGYLTSTDGFENDISDRQYFKDMMAGGKYISDPSFNTATGKQIIFVGVPLKDGDRIVGAMTLTFDASKLGDLINGISYQGAGSAYMLGATGNYIAGPDQDKVTNKFNAVSEAAVKAELKEQADVESKMIAASEQGQSSFNGNHVFWIKPESGVSWTLVFTIPSAVFNSELMQMNTLFVVAGVIGILLFTVTSYVIGSIIGKRLTGLKTVLVKIADGDFTAKLNKDEMNSPDEIGIIYRSLQDTLQAVRNTVEAVKESIGELSGSMNTLVATADELKTNTETVNQSLNEIQQGNGQQSEEINNINIEMEHFNQNSESSMSDISGVVEIADGAGKTLTASNKEMEKLGASYSQFTENFNEFRGIIEKMNESLSSITMITSSISEISSQTNLLSLNASIEAARAGEVGRGFAVVAQEIGKLASESAESANQISDVIGNILESGKQLIDSTALMDDQMENQKAIFAETITSIKKLSGDVGEMIPMIQNMAKMTNENFEAGKKIGDSIQSANAISEELAATTTEVANTTEVFTSSSESVSEVTEQVQALTKTLSEEVAFFKV